MELTNIQKLLIVDDEPGNIEVLIALLHSDFKVQVANNGEKALNIIMSENPPDVVLLDVHMPGIDGYEVCRRMQADLNARKIPVIFITVNISEQDEIKGFEVGAVDYVTKPFNPVIVKARVQTHAELKKYRDYLENQSLRDGLTNIPNRRRFDEYLASAWDWASRISSSISLIMLDIDYFKKYNDLYGHQEGDLCLIAVARTLESTLRRKIDLIARYGGEEFACILPFTDMDGAIKIAEQFHENIHSLQIPHAESLVGPFVTISAGVACVTASKDLSPDSITRAADKALYNAKELGRDRVICHSDIASSTPSSSLPNEYYKPS